MLGSVSFTFMPAGYNVVNALQWSVLKGLSVSILYVMLYNTISQRNSICNIISGIYLK